MVNSEEGCLICESQLKYLEKAQEMECSICGGKLYSNALCLEGHFVCDECHRKKGIEDIRTTALSSTSKNPMQIADDMMHMKSIHMHGPEHHFLVAAVLLAAYSNQCNINDSEAVKNDIIVKAEQRAINVPGGICGLWGSCGAAVGAGIFVSIITEATPLTIDSWSKANLMVSNALKAISENGGPRCCKRNTYLAISSALDFLETKMNIYLERMNAIECEYFERNNECKHDGCIYYRK